MHCALRRYHNKSSKLSDKGKGSLLRKYSEVNNFRASSEDCEPLSLFWRNTDHRCAFLTFLTLNPNGHVKIIALPLHCYNNSSNHLESGGLVEMAGLKVASPPPVNSFKVDQQTMQIGHRCDNIFSIKPYTTRSCSVSSVQPHPRNKPLTSSSAKLNELTSVSSCEDLFPRIGSSSSRLSSSDATNSSDVSTESSKVEKVNKKNTRKKGRKKGKQKKKPSCESVLTELEVNSEECVHEISAAETYVKTYVEQGNELVSCGAAPIVSLLECSVKGINSDGDCNGINDSEIPNGYSTFIHEANASNEVRPSLLSNLTTKRPVDNSGNGLLASDPVLCNFNKSQVTCNESINCYNDSSPRDASYVQDSLVLDSVSVDWNSESCNIGRDDEKISNGEDNAVSSSEPSAYSGQNGCLDTYNDVIGTSSRRSVVQTVPPCKRGKQTRKASKNMGMYRVGCSGNLHGRQGKENNHSVWQKVRKSDAAECAFELKKHIPVCSLSDVTMKDASLHKKGINVVESNTLSNPEDKNNLKAKTSGKLKRKSSPGSKREYNCYSGKGSQTIKANLSGCTGPSGHATGNLPPNEPMHVQCELSDRKRVGSIGQISSSKVGLRSKRVTSEPVRNMHDHPDELEPVKCAYNTVSPAVNQNTENQNCSWLKLRSSLSQSSNYEAQPLVCLPPHAGNEVSEVGKGVSIAELGRQDYNSGSVMQRWIPVGMKEPEPISSVRSDTAPLLLLDESGADVSTSKNTVGADLASTGHTTAFPSNAGAMCMDDGCIQKLVLDQNTCLPKQHSGKHASAHFSGQSDSKSSMIGADVGKIAQAINNVCKIRLACEAVQMTTGSPIAEFERFLHSASPVICQSRNVQSCRSCLHDLPTAASLCKHEVPNLSLGNLWQWYEKPGSYGLEVRVEDLESSKRLGVDRFAFRAYFVPFLSAIQLFGNQKSCHMDNNNNNNNNNEISEPCYNAKMLEGSLNVAHFPIFSVLIPQPRVKHANIPPVVDQMFIGDEISFQSDDDTRWSEDAELLFEYFEFEAPQLRRPLFERIKELVKSGERCQGYGDPTKLISLDLRDLHPRSWYSVAWYPIYKIPDGNFRAAFLTYHSLGHLVRRSTVPMYESPTNMDACVVSPVVGLQSYNAQSECWFLPKHVAMSQATETQSLYHSGVLEERLRTLEHTASLMARGEVIKGNLTSVNRHPDYEFFLSRRW